MFLLGRPTASRGFYLGCRSGTASPFIHSYSPFRCPLCQLSSDKLFTRPAPDGPQRYKAPARRVRGSFEPRRLVSVRVPWWCPVPPWRCGVPLRPSRVPRPAVVACPLVLVVASRGAGFSRLLQSAPRVRGALCRPPASRVARCVFRRWCPLHVWRAACGACPSLCAACGALWRWCSGVPLPRVPWWWTWRACPLWRPVAARPARLVDYIQSKGQKRRARGAVVRFRWLSKSARRGGLCVPWWNRTTTSAPARDKGTPSGVPCGLCNRGGGGLFL